MKPIDSKETKTMKSVNSKEKIVISPKTVALNSKLPRKIIKDLMCYLCQKNVQEDHFEEHLFFGGVRCIQCKEEFLQCRNFMMVNTAKVKVTCKHSWQYCSDPFDYISAKISGDSTGSLGGSLLPSYVLRKLSFYIKKMDILEKKDPWRSAILQCKTVLPSPVIKSSENTSLLSKPSPVNGNLKVFFPDTTTQQTQAQVNHNINKAMRSVTKSTDVPHEIHPVTKNPGFLLPHLKESDYGHEIYEKKGDLLLSKNYGFEQLEKAVEYIEVTGQCTLQQSNISKKPRPHKTYKSVVIEKVQPEERTSLEFIETPSDGRYYVVRNAVEECPMCYTVLCPSEFTVNVQTFLLSTVCSGCNLTIYIVP